ncbi:hypothetical protein [Methylobacterium trifolii]|uniref:Uncharacterized protein n=1 Tax=Methylobacterium trifolii TaxID=1003092 RepID=A0ABQ4U524_9HYPH|nr:hypothetical protein [Methylobacterium trifolii]GJE62551.1 hypothetical protein MPOCJGCO_4684 [Methylobacterium trifolii]
MVKGEKRRAYLIAVQQRRGVVRVYAVVALSPEAAVAQVTAKATDDMQVRVVGGLSRDTARRLGLTPGEMRLI